MPLVFGISNKLDEFHKLFFFEFDNITEEYLIKNEAEMLSKMFEINIFTLESSKNNYHLISFDILKKEVVQQIQNMVTIESDFIFDDERILFGSKTGDACLRVGKKLKKENPKFLFRNGCYSGRCEAINHLKMYQKLCNIPEFYIPEYQKIPYAVTFVVYNTCATRRKKYQGGLVRKC
jgi:hypothetical protein